jgi:hypothetical protein
MSIEAGVILLVRCGWCGFETRLSTDEINFVVSSGDGEECITMDMGVCPDCNTSLTKEL